MSQLCWHGGRVISIPRDDQHSENAFEKLVSNIVAATNWQNAILASDLRSNDQRQVALEREFARLQYRYIRKRQTKREARRTQIAHYWFWIKKEELAQAVAGCELDPNAVRSGKEGLFKPPYYDRLFDGRPLHRYLSEAQEQRLSRSRLREMGCPERSVEPLARIP
jgi:AIPR protein